MFCGLDIVGKRVAQMTAEELERRRERKRERNKERRANPEYTERERDSQRERRANPEYRESQREYQRKWRLANPENAKRERGRRRERRANDPEYREREKEGNRERATGWTPEMVEAAKVRQKGLCGKCNEPMDFTTSRAALSAVADHCHRTGKPRDLLHNKCNTRLGVYESFIDRSEKWEIDRAYLARHDRAHALEAAIGLPILVSLALKAA